MMDDIDKRIQDELADERAKLDQERLDHAVAMAADKVRREEQERRQRRWFRTVATIIAAAGASIVFLAGLTIGADAALLTFSSWALALWAAALWSAPQ